ncbi:MAG: hypothetical protein WC601_05450 [Desulfotomaculaceae bacterium]
MGQLGQVLYPVRLNQVASVGPRVPRLSSFLAGGASEGYGYSLKRSSALFGDDAPEYLDKVETLNIFGIRADYMRQFKEYLEEEWLPKDDDWQDFVFNLLFAGNYHDLIEVYAIIIMKDVME